MTIDPHRPRLKTVGDPVGLLDVARPDVGGQTIGRVVGQSNRLCLILEGDDAEYGPEDLLLGDLHRRGRVRENGGLEEVSLVADRMPATDQSRALLDPGLHVAQHPLLLPAGNKGPQHRVGILAIADLEVARGRRHGLHHALIHALLDEQSAGSETDLTRVEEDRECSTQSNLIQIRVGEHDARRFAPQLQGDALHVAQRVFDDLLADHRRPGESDLVHPG